MSVANITNGVYKIFNVAYPNQVADLLYPGGANGTIGGFRNNGSKRNQVYTYSRPYSFTSDDCTRDSCRSAVSGKHSISDPRTDGSP
jgi:hypothetical protein